MTSWVFHFLSAQGSMKQPQTTTKNIIVQRSFRFFPLPLTRMVNKWSHRHAGHWAKRTLDLFPVLICYQSIKGPAFPSSTNTTTQQQHSSYLLTKQTKLFSRRSKN